MCSQEETRRSAGFTLIEVMITMVIAMVILGGLLLNFMSQSSQYKQQDKRVDATQDLEFAIRYIASDLQAALIKTTSLELAGSGTASVLFEPAADAYSSGWLSFDVWDKPLADEGTTLTDMRAKRCYQFRTSSTSGNYASTHWQVYYNRHEPDCAAGFNLNGFVPIIGEKANGNTGMRVTHFRIFMDDPNDASNRAGYLNIPPPLPTKIVRDFSNQTYDMPGFTILIEVEVDAATHGSAVDVLNQTITNNKKRIWRYMQVYPAVVVSL